MANGMEQGEKFLNALEPTVVERHAELLAKINSQETRGAVEAALMAGRSQALDVLAAMTARLSLEQVAHIREAKAYRVLPRRDGGEGTLTFMEFCEQYTSRSSRSWEMDLREAEQLGIETVAALKMMGYGVRQRRLLMEAPTPEVQQLVAAADAGSDEAVARLDEIVGELRKLREQQADKAALVERAETAEMKADEADSKARSAEEKRKRAEVSWKAVREENEGLRKRLDTPPRLRDPEQAVLFLERVPLHGEMMGGLIEEAAQTVAHYLEEDQADLILPLARTALDTAATAIGRAVEAYGFLQGICGHLDDEFRPHIALLAMLRGDTEILTIASGVVQAYEKESKRETEMVER